MLLLMAVGSVLVLVTARRRRTGERQTDTQHDAPINTEADTEVGTDVDSEAARDIDTLTRQPAGATSR